MTISLEQNETTFSERNDKTRYKVCIVMVQLNFNSGTWCTKKGDTIYVYGRFRYNLNKKIGSRTFFGTEREFTPRWKENHFLKTNYIEIDRF